MKRLGLRGKMLLVLGLVQLLGLGSLVTLVAIKSRAADYPVVLFHKLPGTQLCR